MCASSVQDDVGLEAGLPECRGYRNGEIVTIRRGEPMIAEPEPAREQDRPSEPNQKKDYMRRSSFQTFLDPGSIPGVSTESRRPFLVAESADRRESNGEGLETGRFPPLPGRAHERAEALS